MSNSQQPTPFKIAVPDAVITDLKERLAKTRYPDQLENAGWKYGTELNYLKGLVEYWQNTYDWRKQEEYLNKFQHFQMDVRGLKVHFIHEKSNHKNAKPLLLCHGWPGSVFEFHKIIRPLTHPEEFGGKSEVFHVIAPSIPGYGFSEAPKRGHFECVDAAEVFHDLMIQLGYNKYYCQGGDWGAIICKIIAMKFGQQCLGIHVNMCIAPPPFGGILGTLGLIKLLILSVFTVSKQEWEGIAEGRKFVETGTGYQKIQGSKPQTLGYGLTDSPVGLLAWILEKFRGWTDCNGQVENALTKDEILTNVMIYWINGNITSSTRLYYESLGLGPKKSSEYMIGYCPVPTGIAVFPKEIYKFPKTWAVQKYNVQHWSVMKKGGHFAALEVPEDLVKDIRLFFYKEKSRL